jgi:hypothetical protein
MLMAETVSLYYVLRKVSLPHYSGICRYVIFKNVALFLEPMGSAAPKVAMKMIDITEVSSNHTVTLLCPAQAFPVPTFR